MSNCMQLIAALLLVFSTILLVLSLLFVAFWHRTRRKARVEQHLHEGINNIGISAIVEYPETPAPLFALLEERYPYSEVVVVVDLQQHFSIFGELIERFRLVRVNHSHLGGVRALYRSRFRAFRRVVLIDLPMKHRPRAAKVAKSVALYDYALRLKGESVVARGAIAHCANIIASHSVVTDISLKSIVGADARLERCDTESSRGGVKLHTDRVLAWRRGGATFALVALCLPSVMIVLAHLSGSRLLLVTAAMVTLSVTAFLYVASRVMTGRNLFIALDTILRNFYRFLVEKVKNIHYLYKRDRGQNRTDVEGVVTLARKRKANQESL